MQLEMAIAIATLAIITRRCWPGLVSLILGATGAAVGVWALAF